MWQRVVWKSLVPPHSPARQWQALGRGASWGRLHVSYCRSQELEGASLSCPLHSFGACGFLSGISGCLCPKVPSPPPGLSESRAVPALMVTLTLNLPHHFLTQDPQVGCWPSRFMVISRCRSLIGPRYLFKPAYGQAVLGTEASQPGEAGGCEFRELAGGGAESPKTGHWPQWVYPVPRGVGIPEVSPAVHGRNQICSRNHQQRYL